MKNHRHYSIFDREKIVAFVVILAVALVIGVAIGVTVCHGEEPLATCWIMCKPGEGSRVEIRQKPDRESRSVGFLECGDWFLTDAEEKDGWIRAYGVGDGGGWIYLGYVVTEKPKMIMERYVCCAVNRVACRRWQAGPQIQGRAGWLYNGQTCEVFCMADGWAVTSRGYIKSEWLEVDPE